MHAQIGDNAPRLTLRLRLALGFAAALAAMPAQGCGRWGADGTSPARGSAFIARTTGESRDLVAHLKLLDDTFEGRNSEDLNEVRKSFVDYSSAVIETADTLMSDADAPEADIRSAAQAKLVALERQAEFLPEERPKLLAAVQAMEKGKHAKVLKTVIASFKLRALCDDITPEALRVMSPAQFKPVVAATIELGKVEPRRSEAPQALFQVAGEAEHRLMDAEALELYKLAEAHTPGTDIARFAAGSAARIEAKGQPLADFKGPSPEPGAPAVNLADLKGKVVLIDYWATWCGPCMAEAGGLTDLRERLGPLGFEILGVSLDDQAARLRDHLAAEKPPWPQIKAVDDSPGSSPWKAPLVARFGISSIPFKLLVDRQGILVATGESLSDIQPKLEALVSPQQATPAATPPAAPAPPPTP
ncbi:TlpA disulfide reductase family protein [Isosphaeraceae bacterium EP7]